MGDNVTKYIYIVGGFVILPWYLYKEDTFETWAHVMVLKKTNWQKNTYYTIIIL